MSSHNSKPSRADLLTVSGLRLSRSGVLCLTLLHFRDVPGLRPRLALLRPLLAPIGCAGEDARGIGSAVRYLTCLRAKLDLMPATLSMRVRKSLRNRS